MGSAYTDYRDGPGVGLGCLEFDRVLASIGKAGGSLSPAYDLNPVPPDLKARVLTTNIDLDEGTCSLDLLEVASGFSGPTLVQARAIIKEVATVTATWR